MTGVILTPEMHPYSNLLLSTQVYGDANECINTLYELTDPLEKKYKNTSQKKLARILHEVSGVCGVAGETPSLINLGSIVRKSIAPLWFEKDRLKCEVRYSAKPDRTNCIFRKLIDSVINL